MQALVDKIKHHLDKRRRRKLKSGDPTPASISSSFINSHSNPGYFKEARITDESSNPNIIKLIHVIKVPDDFHYCNLSNTSGQRSKHLQIKLRKYCCPRTRVDWRFIPDDKIISVEATLLRNNISKRPIVNLEKALPYLREWLLSECQRQGIVLD